MIYLTSFADKKCHIALKRLKKQAESFNVFSKIFIYNEDQLPFYLKSKFNFLLNCSTKGFGYWCWKPAVILKALKNINSGCLLLYLDAGCHLNILGKKRLLAYFDKLNKSKTGIIAFQANKPTQHNSIIKHDGRNLFDQKNTKYIKGDLFDYFAARNNRSFTESQAIGAGVILIKKCRSSLRIINQWHQIIIENIKLLDDSHSQSEDFPDFISHRHDQAIWTCLCIKNKVQTLSAYEYWYPQKNNIYEPDWHALKYCPIHARRDLNIYINTRRAIKKIILKLLKLRKI